MFVYVLVLTNEIDKVMMIWMNYHHDKVMNITSLFNVMK